MAFISVIGEHEVSHVSGRINYFYIDVYINTETQELAGLQLRALPSQLLHLGIVWGGK